MQIYRLKRGDTAWPIKGPLGGAGMATVNLAGASVRFILRPHNGGPVKVDAPAIIVNEAEGVVRYDWQPEDVDTAGTYLAEWEVTFAGGKPLTFPNDDEIKVIIRKDLA